jgi:hypothetical protein
MVMEIVFHKSYDFLDQLSNNTLHSWVTCHSLISVLKLSQLDAYLSWRSHDFNPEQFTVGFVVDEMILVYE